MDTPRKSPTQRLLEQFGRVNPQPAQSELVNKLRASYVAFATIVADEIPDGPEKTVALRHLLESADSAIRAVLFPG